MKERQSFIGKTKEGFTAIWTDKHPKGATIENTITFYTPDDGKVFVDKEGNMVDSVVIQDGINIADYVEIIKPKTEEEPAQEE